MPPVLNTDMEKLLWLPAYRGIMPATQGWNRDDPTGSQGDEQHQHQEASGDPGKGE